MTVPTFRILEAIPPARGLEVGEGCFLLLANGLGGKSARASLVVDMNVAIAAVVEERNLRLEEESSL